MDKIALDLGAGKSKVNHEGYKTLGVDIRNFDGIDIVMNLGKENIPFEDSSIDLISANHLFEHFYPEQLFHCIDECWRVLKPTGYLHIEVPKAGTPAYYLHPDHKIQFIEDTFGFWQVPSGGYDPHGYINKYWHVMVDKKQPFEQHIHVNMYPNKPDGRFDFVEIK
jgi:SAM-dependent methyltransferase